MSSQARILIIDDEEPIRRILTKALEREGYQVSGAPDGERGVAEADRISPDVVLLDLKMPGWDGLTTLERLKEGNPDLPVIMITAHGTVETAIKALKAGAVDYIPKPFDLDELTLAVKKTLDYQALSQEVSFLRSELGKARGQQLVGKGPAWQRVLEQVEQVGPTAATVLLLGESGTGKELVARAIHQASPRRDKPFIAVNCAALPENLLESELFGHEKGAFTGAQARRLGRFELANGGTLFLDEIGDLPLVMQGKILRALQEKTFERVGGQTVTVDVRVVAATNRDLEEGVRLGNFREDLYYRLKVFPLALPPLRQRQEDIPLLAHHFLARLDPRRRYKGFTPQAMEQLQAYPWPGNVRELQNVVERAVIIGKGAYISEGDLALEGATGSPVSRPEREEAPGKSLVLRLTPDTLDLEQVEKLLINQALAWSGGNQTQAARLLGITRSALIYRLEKHGLGDGKPCPE